MEERIYKAFAGHERATAIGKRLHPGEAAPDFSLDYLDLADQDVRTVGLADSAGMVCLLNVITSLNRPLCQHVTRWWETLCRDLPSQACISTISVDSPQMQARWQESEGVLHQLFSASRGEQFGLNYGVWLKEWQQLARAIFVVDRRNCIVYVEYIADQSRGPDYDAAMEAVHQADRQ